MHDAGMWVSSVRRETKAMTTQSNSTEPETGERASPQPLTWTDEFPTTEGAFYWVRHKLNHEDLDVASLLDGSLYFTYGGPTSKSRRRDYEYLGPIRSDAVNSHAELERERDALARALRPLVKYLDNVMANGPECDCPAEGHMCGWPALRLAVSNAREALGEAK